MFIVVGRTGDELIRAEVAIRAQSNQSIRDAKGLFTAWEIFSDGLIEHKEEEDRYFDVFLFRP